MQLYCELKPQPGICYTLAFGKDLVIDPLARQVLLNGKDLRLTRKEFDLLFCLASNPGQVFSRKQLYSHVWDEHAAYNVDEVVKTQIKTLRQKLSTTGNESKIFSIEVLTMKIAFYCRIGGKGYGFLLPEDAEKLREFFAEHQEPAALEKTSSAS